MEHASNSNPMTRDANGKRWLNDFLASRWVARDGPAMSPVLAGENEIAIGPYRTTRQAMIDSQAGLSGQRALEMCLLHDGWKIQTLKRYRPLVYYAAFGDDDIFGCLRASLASLLSIAQWTHDIAVLTRTEDVAKVRAVCADVGAGDRIQIETVPGADMLDWCLARYRLDAAEVFADHQPILYLDVDVICDAPLDDLCLKMSHSERVEVLPEGRLDEGDPASVGHWFGWPLMVQDGVAANPSDRGFSSGILGFANKAMANLSFVAVLRSAYAYAEQTGARDAFAGYDQPFANYVMRKLRSVSGALLPSVAQACRVDPIHAPLPVPRVAVGMAHFNGMVGHGASKRPAMENYLALLKERQNRAAVT